MCPYSIDQLAPLIKITNFFYGFEEMAIRQNVMLTKCPGASFLFKIVGNNVRKN